MLKLILVRHGETQWNKEGRVQGADSDTELNETGIKQAKKLTSYLKGENIATVISSPLKRALSTATAIATTHQLAVKIDEGFSELRIGDLEGLPLSELGTSFSQFLMQWWQKGDAERLPGGESLVELQERAWSRVEHLLAEHRNGTVMIVSHYFVILVIILKALGLPLQYFPRFHLGPGGISILEFKDYGTRLIAFNDTSYLLLP